MHMLCWTAVWGLSVLLIKCLVPHREGPDVRVELHGNKEARHGARKGPSRPDGLWERCLPASLTSVVEVRGSPPSHLLYNRSSLRPVAFCFCPSSRLCMPLLSSSACDHVPSTPSHCSTVRPLSLYREKVVHLHGPGRAAVAP